MNILLLVLAGAIGGAVVMTVAQRPARRVAALVPVAAHAPDSVPVPQPPAETPLQTPVETPLPPAAQPPEHSGLSRPPEPITAVKPVSRPARERRTSPFHHPPETAVASLSQPDPVPSPQVAPAPQAPPPAPEPPAPALEPTAPASPEPENVTPPPAPNPAPNMATLNAGMLIPVRLLDGISTERNAPGDAFTATLYRELVADGFVIAERGARVEGRVVSVDRGSPTRGGAAVAVELTRIHTSDNQDLAISTDTFLKRSEPHRTTDAEKVAGGAAIGAIIGAIAGGGKGAAIGAGAGAGAGVGDVMLTRKPSTLPSETVITFRLRAPVTITERMP